MGRRSTGCPHPIPPGAPLPFPFPPSDPRVEANRTSQTPQCVPVVTGIRQPVVQIRGLGKNNISHSEGWWLHDSCAARSGVLKEPRCEYSEPRFSNASCCMSEQLQYIMFYVRTTCCLSEQHLVHPNEPLRGRSRARFLRDGKRACTFWMDGLVLWMGGCV